jgi:hypothetical protein
MVAGVLWQPKLREEGKTGSLRSTEAAGFPIVCQ